MKKTYRIEGLDCANCAAKIEGMISKLDGVNSCTINFITGKIIIVSSRFCDFVISHLVLSKSKIHPSLFYRAVSIDCRRINVHARSAAAESFSAAICHQFVI